MPEAILLKDVETLGEQGTVVDVSKGYLRNYLIPRKLAQPATKGAIETIRQRQAAAERAAREAVERAQENVNLLNRTVLTIPQQAGADGRLFGSVTAQDIASAIREARGLRLDKRSVHLPEPIKNVGTYMVVVEVVDGVHRDDQDDGRRQEIALRGQSIAPAVRGGSRVAPVRWPGVGHVRGASVCVAANIVFVRVGCTHFMPPYAGMAPWRAVRRT